MWHVVAKQKAKTEFGRWLDRQMDRLDLNITGLARLVGVSHASVSDWRRGKNAPTEENVRSLAQALHVTPLEVYAAMGLIPSSGDLPEDVQQIAEVARRLTGPRRRAILALTQALLEEQQSDQQERDAQG